MKKTAIIQKWSTLETQDDFVRLERIPEQTWLSPWSTHARCCQTKPTNNQSSCHHLSLEAADGLFLVPHSILSLIVSLAILSIRIGTCTPKLIFALIFEPQIYFIVALFSAVCKCIILFLTVSVLTYVWLTSLQDHIAHHHSSTTKTQTQYVTKYEAKDRYIQAHP